MDLEMSIPEAHPLALPDWIDQRDVARATLDNLGDAVITTTLQGEITYMNPAAATLTGWRREVAVGHLLSAVFRTIDEESRQPVQNPVDRCRHQGAFSADAESPVLRTRDDREVAIHYRVAPIRQDDGHVVGVALSFADMSEVRQAARDLTHRAHHDPLTGLCNRSHFEAQLADLLDEMRSGGGQSHALLYIDLDNFKVVNDTAGHAAGDALLRELSEALGAKIRRGDILARLGGDEFAALLYDCDAACASAVAQKLVDATRGYQFSWEGQAFRVGASIGVATIDAETEDTQAVMRNADAACYAAKDAGRNQCHMYRRVDDDKPAPNQRLQTLHRLKTALADDRLCLFAQPIAPLLPDSRGGVELFVRLDDEEGKSAAQTFYSAAERYRLAPNIDRWVLSEIVKQRDALTAMLAHMDFVTINVSSQSFVDRNFAAYLVQHIENAGLRRDQVVVEITETAAVTHLNTAVEFINLLRRTGLRVALDNFGSGFSSWAHLRDIPFDFVKIDGSLTRDAATDPVALAMVRAIVDVVKALGKQVVGEHIEQAEVKNALLPIGVAFGQGYFFGAPIPLQDAVAAVCAGPAVTDD